MRDNDVEIDTVISGAGVYVALGKRYLGSLKLSDEPKDNAKDAIVALRKNGISQTVMLSGDKSIEAQRISSALSIDSCRAELLPADKVYALEEIMNSTSGLCAYVGDGINDAPVLARADVGIAMGALGSDAAIEAADIVLMNDNLERINDAVSLSRRTRRIVIQNIVFALAVKGLALILGALGILSLGLAIFADVGVAVIAILNSMRNLK
jgi:Cd2+/Zn2+-exporting ATPase